MFHFPIDEFMRILDRSQWNHIPDFSTLTGPITTRDDVRNMKMDEGVSWVKTSGSTGEQLQLRKTQADRIWYVATSIREKIWLNWDVTKTFVVIKPDIPTGGQQGWGLPTRMFPVQGLRYTLGYLSISKIQKTLEALNPHYIHAAPSIIAQLDLTKLSNFIDHKGTGELGGSMYSSEECGTIALRCPDNPEVFHVMENQIVEVDEDGAMLITCLTNPYIKRYKHGDHIELGECFCGRNLQTITKIHGRVRNMLALPGDKKWATIGGREYYTKFGIKRFKAVQTQLDLIEMQIIRDEPFNDNEKKEFDDFVNKCIGSSVRINIVLEYVTEFPLYKFEEFICVCDSN